MPQGRRTRRDQAVTSPDARLHCFVAHSRQVPKHSTIPAIQPGIQPATCKCVPATLGHPQRAERDRKLLEAGTHSPQSGQKSGSPSSSSYSHWKMSSRVMPGSPVALIRARHTSSSAPRKQAEASSCKERGRGQLDVNSA